MTKSRLESIHASNAEHVSSMAGVPVAVFVGGTSGIGQGMAEAFARWRGGRAHIVIVGRNQNAAKEIIDRFPKPPTTDATEELEWTHEFIQCDATLMSNVHATSQLILSKHPKINFLVLSAGFMSGSGRDESPEGIDRKLAVHYYSRWKFIRELEGGLRKAKEGGEEARVLSVLAPGRGTKVDLDDLGLKKSYTLRRAEGQGVSYNDYMIEAFHGRNPDITFTHAFPGAVDTPIFSAARTPWMRSLRVLMPVLRPFITPKEDCAEYMWHGLLSNCTPGARRIGSGGQVLEGIHWGGDEEVAKKVWEHTEDATRVKE
ncbi:hypothetical protein DFP72DRAFT_1029256 [Ephemerocybe angulata]|uniref:NAD(P)-binding protein n=1 Tax=Ephemerocybe angulata TaxID=980116 RepID=A0A8H6IH45_9AGAR|nr:hypothetical protein DFP72DRAFT_1029256 [Tulosesus angulatus]